MIKKIQKFLTLSRRVDKKIHEISPNPYKYEAQECTKLSVNATQFMSK
jgi:hypothetical protein